MRVLIASLTILGVLYLLLVLNGHRAVRDRLPGQAVFDAGKRLGWIVRPDPFQDLGAGFYFIRDAGVKATPDVFLAGRLAPGLVYARIAPPDRVPALAGIDEAIDVQRVAGWELRGDVEMVAALARELAP
jgi:hypothetical protein